MLDALGPLMNMPPFLRGFGAALLMPMVGCAVEMAPAPAPISTNSGEAEILLSTDEAKQALTDAHEPKSGPGSDTWRYLQVQLDFKSSGPAPSYITNIVYEWHRPDGRAVGRTESFDSRTNSVAQVRVENEEGSWALYDQAAVLLIPSQTNRAKGVVKTPGGFDWYLGTVLYGDSDPKLADDALITGNRFQQDGRWFLRITKQYGEKSKAEVTRKMKKQVPLLFRPFFKTADLRKLVDDAVPFRSEQVLNPDTHTVLVWRAYSSVGWLVYEVQGWQPWEDLPAEKYVVPKALRRIRPKSADEAQRFRDELQPLK
jgi:hypothetical protein